MNRYRKKIADARWRFYRQVTLRNSKTTRQHREYRSYYSARQTSTQTTCRAMTHHHEHAASSRRHLRTSSSTAGAAIPMGSAHDVWRSGLSHDSIPHHCVPHRRKLSPNPFSPPKDLLPLLHGPSWPGHPSSQRACVTEICVIVRSLVPSSLPINSTSAPPPGQQCLSL